MAWSIRIHDKTRGLPVLKEFSDTIAQLLVFPRR